MKLEITCKNCKKDFEIKSTAISRYDLENERGRYFNEVCGICHVSNEYHVNQVYAAKSTADFGTYISIGMLALILFAIITFKTGVLSYGLIIAPIFVYFKLKQAAEKSVEQFNEHKISKHK